MFKYTEKQLDETETYTVWTKMFRLAVAVFYYWRFDKDTLEIDNQNVQVYHLQITSLDKTETLIGQRSSGLLLLILFFEVRKEHTRNR
jgi:hypothetical protein